MWPGTWDATRSEVLDRDGFACRRCSTDVSDVPKDRLHVHHVRPRSRDGPDEPENLLTLCHSCHDQRHRGRDSYYDEEFVQTVRGYGPITTTEAAEWMGCHESTARKRLGELADEGRVATTTIEGVTAWRPRRGIIGRIAAFLSPF